jgi:uncharacterized damage-inducible protein DinB
MSGMKEPEPWLRGPLPGVDPLIAPLLRSFEHAREELADYVRDLTPEQVWARPHGQVPLGYHVRHIAGSVNRMMTYLLGGTLTDAQHADKSREQQPGASAEELLAEVEASLTRAAEDARRITRDSLTEPRYVGRLRLPTTAAGLLVHIAEHTQRHVGQAIEAAKLARAYSSSDASGGASGRTR